MRSALWMRSLRREGEDGEWGSGGKGEWEKENSGPVHYVHYIQCVH